MSKNLIITNNGKELYNFTFAFKDWDINEINDISTRYNKVMNTYMDTFGYDFTTDLFAEVIDVIEQKEFTFKDFTMELKNDKEYN